MSKRAFFSPMILLAAVILYSAFGWFIHWLSQLPFSISFTVAAVAMLLNGLLAEIEDRLPGRHRDGRSDKAK